jgi:uncharacterized surface protein with fasciclin (FAS1) repeats
MIQTVIAILVVLLAALAGACQPTPTPEPPTATPVPPTETPMPSEPTPEEPDEPGDTVAAIVAGSPELSSLAEAIEEAELSEKLSSEGPYTLFAPSDAAFEAADGDLLADPDLLFDIVLYHVVEATLIAEDLAASATATSLLGDELMFANEDGNVTVNGIAITEADIVAENGVVHIVDRLLLPPSLGTE